MGISKMFYRNAFLLASLCSLCASQSLPYFEGFENTPEDELPTTWELSDDNSKSASVIQSSQAHAGGSVLQFKGWEFSSNGSSDNDFEHTLSFTVDLSDLPTQSTAFLDFWWTTNYTNEGFSLIRVVAGQNDLYKFTPQKSSKENEWNHVTVDLLPSTFSASRSATFKISFVYENFQSYGYEFRIDSVGVYEGELEYAESFDNLPTGDLDDAYIGNHTNAGTGWAWSILGESNFSNPQISNESFEESMHFTDQWLTVYESSSFLQDLSLSFSSNPKQPAVLSFSWLKGSGFAPPVVYVRGTSSNVSTVWESVDYNSGFENETTAVDLNDGLEGAIRDVYLEIVMHGSSGGYAGLDHVAIYKMKVDAGDSTVLTIETTQDIVTVISFVLLGVFAFATLIAWAKSPPDAEPLALLMIGVSINDFIGDASMMADLSGTQETLFIVGMVFLVVSVASNMSVIAWAFWNESKKENDEKTLWKHYSTQKSFLFGMLLICTTNADSLNILSCEIFGWNVFSAPISKQTSQTLTRLGLLGNVFEDIPQLVIQIIVFARGAQTLTTALSMTGSLIAVCFGMARKIYITVKHFKAKDAYQSADIEDYTDGKNETDEMEAVEAAKEAVSMGSLSGGAIVPVVTQEEGVVSGEAVEVGAGGEHGDPL